MLDSDLAILYAVTTGNLNKAVARNRERFPVDFMFQLTSDEADSLRFQFGISNKRGGRRYLPYAFTEQGIAMLSSVLHSQRAIDVNIEIMRAFARLSRLQPALALLAPRFIVGKNQRARPFSSSRLSWLPASALAKLAASDGKPQSRRR